MRILVVTGLMLAAGVTSAISQQVNLGGGVYSALGSGLAVSADIGLTRPPTRVLGVRFLWSETHGADVNALGVFLAEKRPLFSVPLVLEAAAFASWQRLGSGTQVSPAISAGMSVPVITSGALLVMFNISSFLSTETAVPLLGIHGRLQLR